MFRPGLGPGRDHPHGGGPPRSNIPFQGPPMGMMSMGSPFPPVFPMSGRGNFHPPFSGQYPVFSPSGMPPSGPPPLHPPPPPDSPPVDAPPPPPSESSLVSLPRAAPPPPPPMPRDSDMMKNIEILSAFVVKNGPQFESMARAKQAGDPKFAFLFGGERGTDAALGYDFYEWKKHYLMWQEEKSRGLPHDISKATDFSQQGQRGGPFSRNPDGTSSPAGSDMDMEDDFSLPPPTAERKVPITPRPAESRGAESRGAVAAESRGGESSGGITATGSGPVCQDVSQQSKALQQAQGVQATVLEQQGSGVATFHVQESVHVSGDVMKISQDNLPMEVTRRRDTRRRTGFDRPRMEDLSPQPSPPRMMQQEIPSVQCREAVEAFDPDRRQTLGNGHQDEVTVRASRWGPSEPSSAQLETRDFPERSLMREESALGSGKSSNKWDPDFQVQDERSSKNIGESPRSYAQFGRPSELATARVVEKTKALVPRTDHGAVPAVDEFGRLVRMEGSDSDGDDNSYSGGRKRRRSLSRSRSWSRSPGDLRRKWWSPSRSRRGRRSWSQRLFNLKFHHPMNTFGKFSSRPLSKAVAF